MVACIVNLRILSIGCLLTLCGLSLPASAVIVAGASGGGNTINNTTAAQYFTETGNTLPVFGNVIRYGGNGSGVYLGYNANTREVWVLTARHIGTDGTAGATVSIDGLSYDRVSDGAEYAELVVGDLRLVKYKRVDNQVPSLTALSLSSTIPTASTALVMAGFGRNRVEDAATTAGTSDAVSTGVGTGYHWGGTHFMRWGTNVVEDLGGGDTLIDINLGYLTTTFITDFDEPSGGQWLSSNEAQGSSGDSGGAAFINNNGQWILAGIMSAIGGYVGQDANSAAFGNLTYITDISTYRSDIDTAIGIGVTLIPEPSVAALLATIGALALLRRRR